MKSIQRYEILENKPLTHTVMRMVLKGPTDWIKRPGQFLNLEISGQYLKRPISIADWDAETLTLIYKIVGIGTRKMSLFQPGQQLAALVGLGNGFALENTPDTLLLIGGGVGIPPLYGLAKQALALGKQVTAVLGFASAEDVFYSEEFKALGISVYLCTDDGSAGICGTVIDVMEQAQLKEQVYMACGPKGMLKAITAVSRAKGYLSLEERMGCGFGACMGCSQKTISGSKRICTEGPVFESEEIIWEK